MRNWLYRQDWFRRAIVEFAVPFNRALGIKIASIAPDSSQVVLRLPRRRKNENVAGTVHGGAILALAESVHGVAVLWQFPPGEHVMYTKRAELDFVAPARDELRVSFSLDAETRARIETNLESEGRCEFNLASTVTTRNGNIVAVLQGIYVIRRLRA